MMAPLLTAFLCVFLTLTAAAPGLAEGGTLRVAFNSFPPAKVKHADGTYGGIDITLLQLLAKRLDLDIQFEDMPFKRGLKMVEHGDIDLAVGVLRRPEREEYAHFLTPPYSDTTAKVFYVLKGKEQTITRYEDLHTLIIGTQIGTKYFPCFDNDRAIAKHEVSDIHLNVRMLRARRIDAFIMSEFSGDKQLAELDLEGVIVKAPYKHIDPQSVYMILSKRSQHAPRLDEFNKELRTLIESGTYKRIEREFLSSPSW